MKYSRLILTLIILVLLAAALPASAQDALPTPSPFLSGTPVDATTAANTLRLAVTPTLACTGAPRTRLIVRERARVTMEEDSPLNMREGAGTSFQVIAQLDPGEIVFVLEGPVCSQRYAWYLVEFDDIEGWIAEGNADAYFVEVYPPE